MPATLIVSVVPRTITAQVGVPSVALPVHRDTTLPAHIIRNVTVVRWASTRQGAARGVMERAGVDCPVEVRRRDAITVLRAIIRDTVT